MGKPKIRTINVTVNGSNEIKVDVRFNKYDCLLSQEGKGFSFSYEGMKKVRQDWWSYNYKLVKYPDHILLKSNKTDKTLTGTKHIMGQCRYPYYGKQCDTIIESYGAIFSVKQEGDDIKLFPVYIEEVKQVTEEIIKAITRYETENNLIQK